MSNRNPRVLRTLFRASEGDSVRVVAGGREFKGEVIDREEFRADDVGRLWLTIDPHQEPFSPGYDQIQARYEWAKGNAPHGPSLVDRGTSANGDPITHPGGDLDVFEITRPATEQATLLATADGGTTHESSTEESQ